MKRTLFCFMVISFFLCLGGYGQAAQFLDRVSFTVVGYDIDGDVSYDDVEMESLIGQTLDLFIVVYDDTSTNASVWDNETGDFIRDGDSLDPDYMTFMSDASYLLGNGLVKLLDVFNFVQPSYPSVRQVYGQINGTTTYDYVFWWGESGFTFDYFPDGIPTGSITLVFDQATVRVDFVGDQDSVKRLIINFPVKAKAPRPLPIGGIR